MNPRQQRRLKNGIGATNIIKLSPLFGKTPCVFPKCSSVAHLGVNEGAFCRTHGAIGLRLTFGFPTGENPIIPGAGFEKTSEILHFAL